MEKEIVQTNDNQTISRDTTTIANIAQNQLRFNLTSDQVSLDKEMARELQKCNMEQKYDSMTMFHIRMPENKSVHEKMKITQDFKSRLNDAGIHGLIVENGKLIIKTEDLDKVRNINMQLCLENSYKIQEIDRSQYENVIAKSNKFPDKDIMELKDLDRAELEILKNNCNQIQSKYGTGFTIGVEQTQENTFNIVVAGDNIMTNDKNKDFCLAYAQTALALYGPNEEIKREEIDADIQIDESIMNMTQNADYQYIVSATNRDRYIRINEEGFDVINIAQDEFGQPVPHVIKELHNDIDDPEFNKRLYQQLDFLEDKVIITDINELKAWRDGNEMQLTNLNPNIDTQNLRNIKFEEKFAQKIDEEIRRNFDKYGLKFESAFERFDGYKNAFVTIIESCSTGMIPDNMDNEYGLFMSEVQDLANKYNVDIADYYGCVDMVQFQKIDHHPAKEAKIIDIDVSRERYKNEQIERSQDTEGREH